MPNPAVSGMETFDHLTDKAQRFLFLMQDERSRLEELRGRLLIEQQRRDELAEKRTRLLGAISELEARRSSFDDKVTTLIDALGDVPIRK